VTTNDLLAKLQALEIDLWTDNGQLRYSGPTEALTDELLQTLVAHKGEILQSLDEMVNEAEPQRLPITRRDHAGDLALSHAQQRLWLLDQLSPGSPAYNIPMALRLTGVLDQDALAQSLDAVIARHEVLRTRFELVDGRPRQLIEAEAHIQCKWWTSGLGRDESGMSRCRVASTRKPWRRLICQRAHCCEQCCSLSASASTFCC